MKRRLSRPTRVYASTVIAAGSLVGLVLLTRANVLNWSWTPVILFGGLGIAAAVFSLEHGTVRPSGMTHQIGTSFAYALLLLADPAAVCVVLWVMNAADWAMNRRRPLTAVFNMAQMTVALGAAVAARTLVRPGFEVLDDVDRMTLGAAAASLTMFFLVSEGLTQIVVNLANRRSWYSPEGLTLSGVVNEVLCVVSGLGMAVFWYVDPWLVVLGVAPMWLVLVLLRVLSRREQELASREVALRSLQDLGLEIGAELDEQRLWRSTVRIAADALQASGAMLAALDSTREELHVLAHIGIRPAPPPRLRVSRFADGFFETGAIRRVDDFRAQRDVYPELSFLDASGLLCAPLEILGRPEGLLVLTHGQRRRPFDRHDSRRLRTLVRFVDVALSNAKLVTEMRRMQEQLVRSEKLGALGRLVSGLSHELSGPLASIRSLAAMARRVPHDPELGRALDRMLDQTRRAMRVVENLATFSREHAPEREPVDLNRALDRALERREQALSFAGVEIVRRLTPELPLVLADPDQLEQVFRNLLDNAREALAERDRPGRIVVETAVLDDWVRVEVADNGPGILPEHQDHLFLPFFTTKPDGTSDGLGLAVSYGIVKEHGGRIGVDSHPGEGACFRVELPIAPAARTTAEPASLAAGRLLVVDESAAVVDAVVRYLEPRGWTVATARDGAQALDRIAEHDFDVVMVDLRMPDMGGREFHARLRDRRPDLARRVVFSTGAIGASGQEQIRGGVPVLAKPYDLRALGETLARIADSPSPLN